MADHEDFSRVVDAHYERIYRLARIMSGNEADACDLAQETFLAAMKGRAEFRGESAMSTWLIGILRRRFLLSLRKHPTPELAPTAYAESREPLDIGPALARLSEPVRTTLVMFYFDKMDYASIASALGCPLGTVRSRLHQGREQLRGILAPQIAERTP